MVKDLIALSFGRFSPDSLGVLRDDNIEHKNSPLISIDNYKNGAQIWTNYARRINIHKAAENLLSGGGSLRL